jgi:hypothetical protein
MVKCEVSRSVEFVPVKVELTLESAAEVMALFAMLNSPDGFGFAHEHATWGKEFTDEDTMNIWASIFHLKNKSDFGL